MEIRRITAVIWKWLWLIVLATLLVGGATYYLSASMTPVYQASTILQVDEGISARTDLYTALAASERSAKTYVELVRAPAFLEKVSATLDLPLNIAESAITVRATQIQETQLIRVVVEDTDRFRAAAIADAVAATLIAETNARERARYEAGKRELDAQIASLEAKIKDTQNKIAYLQDPADPQGVRMPPETRASLINLQSQLSSYQTQYVILLQSAESFRLAAASYTANISVISSAKVPAWPIKPRTLVNTVLGLVGGILLGLTSAFVINYLDDTVRTAEEVTRSLGLVTLGIIGRFTGVRKLSDGLMSLKHPRSSEAEAYRALSANIRFSLLANPATTLLVTSPGAQEGKSTTAANLAVALAQTGHKVLLVDADLRRPCLHRVFGVTNGIGLTGLLLQERFDLPSALSRTDVPGLSLLTSGPIPPNPAELLGSPRMLQLLETLKKETDFVIFDTPPVLAVTDANFLAARVEATLLVLETSKTRLPAALRAKESLTRVGATMLGAVLNKQKTGRHGYYYYYYYAADGQKHPRKRKAGRSRGTAEVGQTPAETAQSGAVSLGGTEPDTRS